MSGALQKSAASGCHPILCSQEKRWLQKRNFAIKLCAGYTRFPLRSPLGWWHLFCWKILPFSAVFQGVTFLVRYPMLCPPKNIRYLKNVTTRRLPVTSYGKAIRFARSYTKFLRLGSEPIVEKRKLWPVCRMPGRAAHHFATRTNKLRLKLF